MLARAPIPPVFKAWNRAWGAPFGHKWRFAVPRRLRVLPGAANLCGMFALQSNNTTRAFEYPWAFYALNLLPGMRILEIGGGKSGFQFVLDRLGCCVTNVDPGNRARGKGWPLDPRLFGTINRRFGTSVMLKHCLIDEANLPDESFEGAVSISTIEHVPKDDIAVILHHVRRALLPGGLFVITLDLFPDLAPFTARARNYFGRNVSARWMIEESQMELVQGCPAELFGFAEFDVDGIRRRRDLLVGRRGVMVQTMVLRKTVPP